jgi:hypothetical protein
MPKTKAKKATKFKAGKSKKTPKGKAHTRRLK